MTLLLLCLLVLKLELLLLLLLLKVVLWSRDVLLRVEVLRLIPSAVLLTTTRMTTAASTSAVTASTTVPVSGSMPSTASSAPALPFLVVFRLSAHIQDMSIRQVRLLLELPHLY